jgi:glycerol-3-phosphate dehydrogenase
LSPIVTTSTRREAIARLRAETFDALIIGGGINGAGTARDLALRAKTAGVEFSVALVEQNHFASGTSGKNSHLIHGGLRYLKQLDVGLVRESLSERSILLRIAPHVVEPQPFLMPLAGVGREIFYTAGLTLYDLLSGSRGLPHHRRVSLEEVRRLEPGLAVAGMTAAAEYYDARVLSARLVLENVFEAIANGAACANYVRVEGHEKENPGIWRVRLRDTLSNDVFETRARSLIDATGPWAHDPAPRLVRGSHIVLPRLNASGHAIAYFEESGRIIFLIPWGDQTLVGTTDVDHNGSPDDVHISKEEITYLRAIAAKVFPASAEMEPVAAFSSLRPLLAQHGSATRASRDHRIFHDPQGILRITGGKYTTYRSMSEEAADLAAPALKHIHVTADFPLNGNTPDAIQGLLHEAPAIAAQEHLETSQIILLVRQYGVLAPAVLESMPETDLAGLSRFDAARLIFAIRHEMAQKPEDFLTVSTALAYEGSALFLTPEAWRLASQV